LPVADAVGAHQDGAPDRRARGEALNSPLPPSRHAGDDSRPAESRDPIPGPGVVEGSVEAIHGPVYSVPGSSRGRRDSASVRPQPDTSRRGGSPDAVRGHTPLPPQCRLRDSEEMLFAPRYRRCRGLNTAVHRFCPAHAAHTLKHRREIGRENRKVTAATWIVCRLVDMSACST
jgi:hypothetical protein